MTAQVDDATTSPNQDTEPVVITVVDVNDNNPVFQLTPYSFTAVPENSASGISVGEVSAADIDEGNNAIVTFEIIGGNDLGYFQIVAASGLIIHIIF